MTESDNKERIIRYGAIGFALGILATSMIYLFLLRTLNLAFSFSTIGDLHRRFNFLYVADTPALLGAIAGSLAANSLNGFRTRLSIHARREADLAQELKAFVHTLIAGDLNSPFEFVHADQSLAEDFNRLKEALIKNREQERKRRHEERQRNWVSEGLALFGDILRTHTQDLESMTYAVVSELVRYLDANQGAIFLTEEKDGEKVLNMVACHAYDRKKFPDRRIGWGSGLVGAVAMEKKGFYTDKVKEGYLTITSGLGKATPRHLLIEPLIWNDVVFGIIEIASFNPLQEYQIQFTERVAVNIATTISTMESNLRTEQLLNETREQADQLAIQEEQARQNMEALKRTQEEAARQADTFITFTNTVNHTLMRAEYAPDGTLLYANTRFLRKLGYSGNREVEGKHISMFISEKDRPWFNSLWTNLSKGGRHFEGYMKHETKQGQELWTMATYTCMRREDGNVEKILFLAIDSTEQKKESLGFEGQVNALDRLIGKAEFSPDGRMVSSNGIFRQTLKYSEKELNHMNVFDFIGKDEQERFNEIWEKTIGGEPFRGQLRMKSKYEEETWFRTSLLSTNDLYGEVERVIFLGYDMSREREMERTNRKMHDQLVQQEEELRLSGMDLKQKLEESLKSGELEKKRLEKEVEKYTRVLDELPYGMVTVNNTGFLRFLNREAAKAMSIKKEKVIGKRADALFRMEESSDIIRNFADPAKTKHPGTFDAQVFVTKGGVRLERKVILIRTDLQDEILYSLLLI